MCAVIWQAAVGKIIKNRLGLRYSAARRYAGSATTTRSDFTPSTKAAVGDHDENISFEECGRIIGKELAEEVRDKAVRLYTEAAEYAKSRGIIICDTKFEFGLDEEGTLTLMDEVLTPDSSRFW